MTRLQKNGQDVRFWAKMAILSKKRTKRGGIFFPSGYSSIGQKCTICNISKIL